MCAYARVYVCMCIACVWVCFYVLRACISCVCVYICLYITLRGGRPSFSSPSSLPSPFLFLLQVPTPLASSLLRRRFHPPSSSCYISPLPLHHPLSRALSQRAPSFSRSVATQMGTVLGKDKGSDGQVPVTPIIRLLPTRPSRPHVLYRIRRRQHWFRTMIYGHDCHLLQRFVPLLLLNRSGCVFASIQSIGSSGCGPQT